MKFQQIFSRDPRVPRDADFSGRFEAELYIDIRWLYRVERSDHGEPDGCMTAGRTSIRFPPPLEDGVPRFAWHIGHRAASLSGHDDAPGPTEVAGGALADARTGMNGRSRTGGFG